MHTVNLASLTKFAKLPHQNCHQLNHVRIQYSMGCLHYILVPAWLPTAIPNIQWQPEWSYSQKTELAPRLVVAVSFCLELQTIHKLHVLKLHMICINVCTYIIYVRMCE